jgi:hypothetical protein
VRDFVTTSSSPTFRFDVALSFAGEDRVYVGDIAERLRGRDVRVFYDQYEQATLWGKDLYEHLDYVYQRAARYCVLFASEHYARKVWTNHERKSAQARALHENEEYILPVRFDDTEIPGLRSTVAYIDARSTTQDELIALILAKLNRPPDQTNLPPAPIRLPWTPEQQRQLLVQRPSLWEYLLLAGVLAQGKAALEPKWQDYQLGYVRLARPALDDSHAMAFIEGAFNEIQAVTGNVERVFDPQVQELAFGPPGVEGDPGQIEHMGQRILEIYEGYLDWAARIRGTPTSERFRRLFKIVAMFVDKPIQQTRDFIDQYIAEMDRLPDRLAKTKERPIHISLELVLEVDPHIKSEFNRELRRLKRRSFCG